MKAVAHLQRRAVRIASLAALGLAGAAPAAAQTGLDADVVNSFGGSYSADCANPAAPRLQVTRDAIAFEKDGRRITGRNLMSQASYFGQSSPPDFRIALVSEVRSGSQMNFLVYADRAGAFIKLDGDAKLVNALGPLARARYRQCTTASGAAAAAPAPVHVAAPGTATAAAPSGAAAGALGHPMALLNDAAFKRTYLRTLGPKASERWLARLEGPAEAPSTHTLDGTAYTLFSICKAHDCYDHNAVFLYAAASQRMLGLIQQAGVKTLVGGATPAQGAQLDRLWQATFRQR